MSNYKIGESGESRANKDNKEIQVRMQYREELKKAGKSDMVKKSKEAIEKHYGVTIRDSGNSSQWYHKQ